MEKICRNQPEKCLFKMKKGRFFCLKNVKICLINWSTCKPDSVPYFHTVSVIYLSCLPLLTSIAATRPGKPCLPQKDQDIHGISTRKVCPAHTLLHGHVGSYPTFSPLPPSGGRWRLFSVTLCCTILSMAPPVRWCGTLRCPDFPPRFRRSDRAVPGCKGTPVFLIMPVNMD